jgi:ribosomal-protein-alanine N-acetyltransferase
LSHEKLIAEAFMYNKVFQQSKMVHELLKGKKVNLRIIEKEDLPLVKEWLNDIDFPGEFEPISQETKASLEKQYEELGEGQWFFIEKKDGTKIGLIAHFLTHGKLTEIGYALLPRERNKGYCSEAVQIMVDYLFLSKNIVRIQAGTNPKNVASHKVLQKAGFRKEAILRETFFSRGVWRDTALFSILREEWKEPKIMEK